MRTYTKRTIVYWLTWMAYYLTFAISFDEAGLVKNEWVFLAAFLLGVAWVYIDQWFDRWRDAGLKRDVDD